MDVDYEKFLHLLDGKQFLLHHCLKSSETFLILENPQQANRLNNAIPGLKLSETKSRPTVEEALVLSPYLDYKESRVETVLQCFSDLYTLFAGSDSGIVISFTPASQDHVLSVKHKIEHELSRKEVKLTVPLDGPGSGSVQNDLYYDSDERRVLSSMLEMLNSSLMNNGTAYNVIIVVTSPSPEILHYIRSKLFISESFKLGQRNLEKIYAVVPRFNSTPFSMQRAALMLSFSDSIPRKSAIETSFLTGEGTLSLGTYMDKGILETSKPAAIPMQNLNLGLMITGLPGAGKSFAAMGIMEKALLSSRPLSMVLAPTDEWNDFGEKLSMKIIRLYDKGSRINFFRCSAEINIERFYENLAMLMASASAAGPYRGPMEKCLLAAFRGVYSKTHNPDPLLVYEAIENAIVERHAKRTNTGIKYTKHGENIMAALQSLRLMLFKRPFAYADGLEFGELLRKGVVFDLSLVSNAMKPFFYALILNQAYSFADSFDTCGDNKLRMMLCVEEAQLIFDSENESAASLDLRQRIQDFRKKGICLSIITHSVTDIDVSIRRLCQNKLYFRQSADAVKLAVADLVFSEEMKEAVADKLKTLEQRVCAASYVISISGVKQPANPVFLKTEVLSLPRNTTLPLSNGEAETPTFIKMVDEREEPLKSCKARIFYVGEEVFSGETDGNGVLRIEGLLLEKKYRLVLPGEKKKDVRCLTILGGITQTIRLEQAASGKSSA